MGAKEFILGALNIRRWKKLFASNVIDWTEKCISVLFGLYNPYIICILIYMYEYIVRYLGRKYHCLLWTRNILRAGYIIRYIDMYIVVTLTTSDWRVKEIFMNHFTMFQLVFEIVSPMLSIKYFSLKCCFN